MARNPFITAASAKRSAHASMIGNQTPSRFADDFAARQLFTPQDAEPRTPAPPPAVASDEVLHKMVEEMVDKFMELKDCQVRIIKHISDNKSTLADLCPEGTRDQATKLEQFMTVTDPTERRDLLTSFSQTDCQILESQLQQGIAKGKQFCSDYLKEAVPLLKETIEQITTNATSLVSISNSFGDFCSQGAPKLLTSANGMVDAFDGIIEEDQVLTYELLHALVAGHAPLEKDIYKIKDYLKIHDIDAVHSRTADEFQAILLILEKYNFAVSAPST